MGQLFICRAKLLFVALICIPACVSAQDYKTTLSKSDIAVLEAKRIQAEMDVTQREIVYYNKELRKKRREQEKMNDKAQRLKYKVARNLSRIDTTVEHRPTYAEWQLSKAEKARDHAALYISNTEPVRQQKIVQLGDKAKELNVAKAGIYISGPYTPDSPKKTPKNKVSSQQDMK